MVQHLHLGHPGRWWGVDAEFGILPNDPVEQLVLIEQMDVQICEGNFQGRVGTLVQKMLDLPQ